MANPNRINFSDVLCSGVEVVNQNTAAFPAQPTGTILSAVAADTVNARIVSQAFAAAAFFTAIRADGTNALPTNLVANDQLGGFNAHGYGATGYVGPAATVAMFAAGTWSDTSSPSYIDLRTTPAASLTMVTRIRVESDGGITIPNIAPGGSQGAGTINVSGGYYVNGVIIPGGSATPQFTRVGIGTPADATNLLTMLGTFTTDNQSILQTITLNNAGVTFTVQKMLVTNTASNAASLLTDWQVGGTSQFKVSIAGALTVPGSISATNGTAANPSYVFASGSTTGMFRAGSGLIGWGIGGTGETMRLSATALQLLSLNLCGTIGTPDVFVTRVAANSMAMANGTSTQTLTINGPYTDASNFQAMTIVGNQIATQTTGTAPGLTSSTPILNLAQTWNSAGVTFTAVKLNVTSTASAGASLLMDLQVGGTSIFSVTKGGTVSATQYNAGGTFLKDSSVTFNEAALIRDAANITSFRNGTTAQQFRVYNTFTSTTSLEYFAIDWQTTANVCSLWTVKGSGGGTARNLVLGTDTTARLTIGATTGTVTLTADIIFGTVAKSFTLTSGTGQRGGTAVLVGGTVTVTNTSVTANTVILLTVKVAGGTLGNLSYTLSAGASFTINSSSVIDTSTVAYLLYEVV